MSSASRNGSAVTAVIVSYGESPAQLREAVAGVIGQQPPAIETLVIDNGTRLAPGDVPGATVLDPGGNIGYGRAVNLAARHAAGDFILCLNPDAVMEAGCLGHLTAVAESDRRVALVGAQILLADGETRNAGANPLHPVGISPSGGYGTPREHGPPADVMVVSGACCLIRSAALAEPAATPRSSSCTTRTSTSPGAPGSPGTGSCTARSMRAFHNYCQPVRQ